MMANNFNKELTKMKNNPDYALKMGFVALGIIVVIAVIFGSWLWNLIFDPAHFNLTKWGNAAVFSGSISLGMMVLGFIAINENLKSKPAENNGKFQKRLTAFNDMVITLHKTGRLIFFDQFIAWYVVRQVREKKITYLTKHGMPLMDAEIIVDYAYSTDIEKISGLKEGQKPVGRSGEDIIRKLKDGTEILIPAIKDTMAAYVNEVLTGVITVEPETASYYTSADKNKKGNLVSLERPQETEKDRVKSMKVSFISKIAIGLVYTTLLALLTVDLATGAGTAESVWNLIYRLVAATLGFIAGGFAGSTNVKFLYKWIGEKMRVIDEYNEYLDLGEFVPKTYNETAVERIKAIHEKEEEAKANVVEPEMVEENDSIKLLSSKDV